MCRILKTDLWNEGVEPQRDILGRCQRIRVNGMDLEFYGIDVSIETCKMARSNLPCKVNIMEAITISLPFYPSSFNVLLDISTIDHVPPAHIPDVLEEYRQVLSENGILMLVFDSGVNFLCEMYHRFYLRGLYPEWTLIPSLVKRILKELGFEILREHGCYLIGLLGGMHLRLPMVESLLRKRFGYLSRILMRIELSESSKRIAFLAPQYVIIARKGPSTMSCAPTKDNTEALIE